MTKFRTDMTKGGYKILSLHGPDSLGAYSGVVDDEEEFCPVSWYASGKTKNNYPKYSLIPITEEQPKDDERITHLETQVNSLRDVIGDTLKRLDDYRSDAIARINGLRNDYLADKDAVSPARVDDLEERLEALEQRTQPSKKGVWVTRESLKYAFDATQEFIMRNDRFKEIAERLGLEEDV